MKNNLRQNKVSIVFSFYNEKESISETIDKTLNVLNSISGIDFELVFVNDCSNDGSDEILNYENSRNKKIKIINMSRRFGHMPCVLAGLKHCTGDAAIHMDIDLQDPPSIIEKMIKVWLEKKCDVVYSKRKSFKNSIFNNILSFFGYKILKKYNYIQLEENAGDFRLISRRVINNILYLDETSNFRFLVDFVGFEREEILYERQERKFGKSKYNLVSVVINFIEGALFPFSDFFLRFSFFLGILGLVLASIFLPVFFFQIFFNNLELDFFNFINFAIFVFVCLQAFVMGVFSVYIGLIFKQTTKRPKYIIKEKKGFND